MTDAADRIDAPPTQAEPEDLRAMVADLTAAIDGLNLALAPPAFATDAEIIRYCKLPRDTARLNFRHWDDHPYLGFPEKNKLWGDRRPLKAVLEFLNSEKMRKMGTSQSSKGKANE